MYAWYFRRKALQSFSAKIRETLAQYKELTDIIEMLGLEQLSTTDRKVLNRARRLERFFTQPFFATEQFSGIKGKEVSLEDALSGCERILADELKDLPESAFYMIGNIDEAMQKATKKKKAKTYGENVTGKNVKQKKVPESEKAKIN